MYLFERGKKAVGMWCAPEIQSALRLGYTLKAKNEIYHWEETTQYDQTARRRGLFDKYINTFLKFKQEANGPLAGEKLKPI